MAAADFFLNNGTCTFLSHQAAMELDMLHDCFFFTQGLILSQNGFYIVIKKVFNSFILRQYDTVLISSHE